MSRRKRRPPVQDQPTANRSAPAAAPPREPNPPQPNKGFLLATALLLAAWIVLLGVMAVTG
ncbi:MAG: hypothetical protein ABIK89_26955 [Planctomycetota bacterium]